MIIGIMFNIYETFARKKRSKKQQHKPWPKDPGLRLIQD